MPEHTGICGHAASAEFVALADTNGLAIQLSPGAMTGDKKFIQRRIEQHAKHRLSRTDKCDGDGKMRLTPGEGARAIYRINNPDHLFGQA